MDMNFKNERNFFYTSHLKQGICMDINHLIKNKIEKFNVKLLPNIEMYNSFYRIFL